MRKFPISKRELFFKISEETPVYSAFPRKEGTVRQNLNFIHNPLFLPFDRSCSQTKELKEHYGKNFSMRYDPPPDKQFIINYPRNSYLPLWEDKRILLLFLSRCMTKEHKTVILDVREIGEFLGYSEEFTRRGGKHYDMLKRRVLVALQKWIDVSYVFNGFKYNLELEDGNVLPKYKVVEIGNVLDHFRMIKHSTKVKVVFGEGFLDSCFESYCLDINTNEYIGKITNAFTGVIYEQIVAFHSKMGILEDDGTLLGDYHIAYKETLMKKSGLHSSTYRAGKKSEMLDLAVNEVCRLRSYHKVNLEDKYAICRTEKSTNPSQVIA